MSSNKELIYDLNQLCKFLDNVYNINSGGCCYLTYLIAKHLEKININYSLMIINSYDKNIDEINNEIKKKKINSNPHNSITGLNTCNHYFLLIDDQYINDYDDDDRNYYKIDNVNYKHIRWIYNNGDWNDSYDTFNNKIIRNIINEFFKKYDFV